MNLWGKPLLFLLAIGGITVAYFWYDGTTRVERLDMQLTDAALQEQQRTQLASSEELSVFHDFRFTDTVAASGISFVNRPVAELARSHYPHGNGLAVADVNNDGLLDIYFVSQRSGNQLWRNVGGGKFENITEAARVGLENKVSISAAFADIDNDGDQDLYVTTVRTGNVLLENIDNGVFRDISRESGTDYLGHSSGAFFFDYDNDGLVDLFVTNIGHYTSDTRAPDGSYLPLADGRIGHLYPERAERSVLFKNIGGNRFRDVTDETQLVDLGWSGDASFTDFNGDAYPDVYVLNMQGDNHYYENQRGRSFIEKTERYFPKTPWGAMGIKFFDYNNDGLVDLYVTDMHTDMFGPQAVSEEKYKLWLIPHDSYLQGGANNIFGNAFYKNVGNGKFVEVSDTLGLETYWPWGPSVGDLNADGYEDIFIPSGAGRYFRYGINSLLLNDRSEKFWNSEFILGIEPRERGVFAPQRVTVDCTTTPGRLTGRCTGLMGEITVRATRASRSAVIFDVENDGDFDIVTNEYDAGPKMFTSDLSERKRINFLKINLVGTTSNRNALGTKVVLHAGGSTQTRYVDGKSGYLSQSQMPLYFGLGESQTVDRIEVTWPSGKLQTVTRDIPLNGLFTIQEP